MKTEFIVFNFGDDNRGERHAVCELWQLTVTILQTQFGSDKDFRFVFVLVF